jgi:hypothetical protein
MDMDAAQNLKLVCLNTLNEEVAQKKVPKRIAKYSNVYLQTEEAREPHPLG